METPFTSIPQKKTITKKAIFISALAVVALVGCCAIVSVNTTEFSKRTLTSRDHFQAWKRSYNKTYGAAEDEARYNIWLQSVKTVETHNQDKTKSYKLGVNQFADVTREEFSSIYLGAQKPKGGVNCKVPSLSLQDTEVAASIDWRQKGRVNPVKNQAQCGSCWAFSTVASLEGLAARDNKIQSFSEQQLVDCTGSYGNFGCGGGWVQGALHYAIDHGVTTESAYPYTATDGTCKTNVPVAFKPTGCEDVPKTTAGLQQALQNGPVSVYVEADQNAWQFYASGVVDDVNCFAEGQIDHAVAAVGYTENAWIVRNSWGGSWGESGYIRLTTSTAKHPQGVCGVLAVAPAYPTL